MNEMGATGFVSLVGAGPGDPDLITLKGVERLGQADLVVYDRLVNPLLLRKAPQAEWISVGKKPGYHPIPQEKINEILVENAKKGKRIVRLKGGDPFVFGRGGEEALALKKAGIQFEIVPGISSAIAAPAYAGIPVTHRNLAGSVAFITGHRTEGTDVPKSDWRRINLSADTLVFMMGVKNLPLIIEQLQSAGRPENTPVALIERGTFPGQKTIIGTLSNIIEIGGEIRPPAVCVVGEVVGLRDQLNWFEMLEQRPLFGLRILNTKSNSSADEDGSHRRTPLTDSFGHQVTSLGGEVIHMPVLQICPPTDESILQVAVRNLAKGGVFDWVVFTSVNGVKAVFDWLAALGADSRYLKGTQVAAIGPSTAQELKNRGIKPDFIPTQFTGKELGKQLPIKPGETIVLPRSEIALPELPAILRSRGGITEEVNAYTVKSAPPDTIVLDQLAAGRIDIVTFFSPSGLYALADILAEAGHTSTLGKVLAQLTVACIGPTTKEAAQKLGIQTDVIAREHTGAGLVQELVKWRKHS